MSNGRGRSGSLKWLIALIVLAVLVSAFYLVMHLLILGGFAVILGGVYLLGRHNEHNRPRIGQPRNVRGRVIR